MNNEPRECPFCGNPAGKPLDPTTTCCIEPTCPMFYIRFRLEDWNRRTPPPKTKAYLEWLDSPSGRAEPYSQHVEDFKAEWPQPEDPAHVE